MSVTSNWLSINVVHDRCELFMLYHKYPSKQFTNSITELLELLNKKFNELMPLKYPNSYYAVVCISLYNAWVPVHCLVYELFMPRSTLFTTHSSHLTQSILCTT